MGQDRVFRIRFVGTEDIPAAPERQRVELERAAMGGREVVISILAIEMRCLEIVSPGFISPVDGSFEMIIGCVEDVHTWTRQFRLFQVDLLQEDLTVSCPFLIVRRVIALVIHLSVVIEKERWIDARSIQPDGGRPGSTGIAGRGDEISPGLTRSRARQCAHDVEYAFVIADRRGIESGTAEYAVQIEVSRVRQHMPDHAPLLQIATLPDRKPGKIFIAAGDDVVVVTRPADGRVRIETRNDGRGNRRNPAMIISLKPLLAKGFNGGHPDRQEGR